MPVRSWSAIRVACSDEVSRMDSAMEPTELVRAKRWFAVSSEDRDRAVEPEGGEVLVVTSTNWHQRCAWRDMTLQTIRAARSLGACAC